MRCSGMAERLEPTKLAIVFLIDRPDLAIMEFLEELRGRFRLNILSDA